MKAMYFYNRLLNYDEEVRKTNKYHYGYSNGMVTIHHKNDENNWFVIYREGLVMKHTSDSYMVERLNIHDLNGDDFELFSNVQILKTGYIVLATKTEYEVKKVISKLHAIVASYDVDFFRGSTKNNIPYLCGGSIWENGVTDGFQYRDPNGIELELKTVRELCKENVNRKHYDAKCIPFDKRMKNEGSIHVRCVSNMKNSDCYDDTYKKCEEALSNLFGYLNAIDVQYDWSELKLWKPIYC